MFSGLRELIKLSIQYACVMHCTFEYVADFVVCNGPSMEPTLHSNNVLLTERITTRFYNPNRGDIIIAKSPTNPNQYICKRVVALAGDRIAQKMVSNTPEDNKIKELNRYEYVPRGFVWIEGDNRENSTDSRYYGPIPMGLIKSRVVCRLWPLSEIKLL